ncbi:MAG: winged helix-turn-helix transcriptional regulator [Candidatus Heimdallarchaeaceae archaeon]
MKEEVIDPAIKEKYEQLWSGDEAKIGIITNLEWYGSLNLKKLSSLINKPESTTLRYVKQLIEEGLIEVDAEKTASSWGKYYALTKPVRELYQKNMQDYIAQGSEFDLKLKRFKEMSDEEIKREVINKLLKKQQDEISMLSAYKKYLSFVQNIQNSIVNELVDFEKRLKVSLDKVGEEETFEKIEIPTAENSIIVRTVQLSKLSHVIKVVEATRDYIRKIKELEVEFKKEIEEEGIPEEERSIQFISVFLGGLSRKD